MSSPENLYKYNGVEQDPATENYEMAFRGYNASLGQFMQIDPLAELFSSIDPYHFGFNNPALFADPLGLAGECFTCGGGSGSKMKEKSEEFRQNSIATGDGNIAATDSYTKNALGIHTVDNKGNRIFNSDIAGRIQISNINTVSNGEGSFDSYVHFEGFSRLSSSGSFRSSSSIYEQNLSDFNWLNLAAAEVSIWGGSTSVAVYGSKPRYTGTGDWTKQVKSGTKFGNRLAGIGLAITAYDMYSNGINTSNSLDAAFGIIGFIGPVGAGISGLYFVGNLVTYGMTGQTIGEHIDNYNWIPNPAGIGVIPIGKKSYEKH